MYQCNYSDELCKVTLLYYTYSDFAASYAFSYYAYPTAAHDHVPVGNLQTDDGATHWHSCGFLGCAVRIDETAHDMAWEYTAAHHTGECADGCGYSVVGTHSIGWQTVNAFQHFYSCSDDCGYANPLILENHTLEWAHNAAQHWQSCSDSCGYGTQKESHTLEWAYSAVQHWQVCSDGCGYSGTGASHSYGGYVSNGASGHRRTCTVCGYVQSTAHTYGGWARISDTEHRRYCTKCSYYQTSAHTYGSWTRISDTQHARSCTAEGCVQREYGTHSCVPWIDGGIETHSGVCVSCGGSALEWHYPYWTGRRCGRCGRTDFIVCPIDLIPLTG